jgi:hypothetical protein
MFKKIGIPKCGMETENIGRLMYMKIIKEN